MLIGTGQEKAIAGAKQNVIPTIGGLPAEAGMGIHSKTAHKHLDSRLRGNDEPHLILFCASYTSRCGQAIRVTTQLIIANTRPGRKHL